MNVKSSIADPGVPEKERLVLNIEQDTDIGRYAVFFTHFTEAGKVSANVERTFWFPDLKVRAGDFVVLYTKKGARSEKENQDKSKSYFFYWNLDAPIWIDKGAAVLAYLPEWTTVNPPK